LLTHAETFFSVFVPDIRKANKLARFIEYDVIDQSQAGVVDVDA